MSIEGEPGPGVPNPCASCGRHSTRPGKPSFKSRRVTYTCPFCSEHWSRPFEDDLYSGAVVRVDLDDGYVYGMVEQVEGDRVQVWPDDRSRKYKWFDLWRVIEY